MPEVTVLSFAGCPHREATIDLVERVVSEAAPTARVTFVDVSTVEDALRLRFLGSPTVQVDGQDIEPGADARDDFALACRLYRTARGLRPLPDEIWLRRALAG